MLRRHISAPPWLWQRIEELARIDGRTVAELVRRLLIRHLREEDPDSRPLPNAQRLASYKRASRSLDGTPTTRKRKPKGSS